MPSEVNAEHSAPAMSGSLELVFLRRPAVEKKVGLSTSEIYRRMRDGTFPKCIHLSKQRVVWDEREIIAWQQQMLAAR